MTERLARESPAQTGGLDRATAFAPASVGNVAIGFDILGMAVDALGDRVTVSRSSRPGVRITSIRGVPEALPLEAARNTAGRALLALYETVKPDFGFEMEIEKGIPLGSGLGGSAASAVGAVVAANAVLPEPVGKLELTDRLRQQCIRRNHRADRGRGRTAEAGSQRNALLDFHLDAE